MQERQTVLDIINAYAPYSYILVVLSVTVLAMIIRFIMPGARTESRDDSVEEDSE